MDINGTRFHLIADPTDWQKVMDTSPAGGAAEWDPIRESMGLKPLVPIFPRGKRSLPLTPDERRGAACDRFGTWYWIGQDQQTLFRAPAGTTRAVIYWQQSSGQAPARSDRFVVQNSTPLPSNLAGLAVTTHHYLVVGALDPSGLLIFDLHAGGEPIRLELPPEAAFVPFDLTAAPDGGVWVLDRRNRRLWGLDRYFRLLPLTEPLERPPEPGSFSTSSIPEEGMPIVPSPQGLDLAALDPIAVEALPDGGLLVLDTPAAPEDSSRLFHYTHGHTSGTLLSAGAPLVLPGLIEIGEESDHSVVIRPVVGHDMAYRAEGSLLYVVERDGNQAVAYLLKLPEQLGQVLSAAVEAIYLPMHYHGGRAMVAGVMPNGESAVFYDVTPFPDRDLSVRWLRIQSIDRPRFARRARIESPVLDGHQRACVWHRLFLDACIPQQTEVRVFTRCGDDYNLLSTQSYRPEPQPYLRGMGPEIAYWQDWPSQSDPGTSENVGTWEVLFQQATGQYLQICLELIGNGRASPQIRRLRAYYPRFSYLQEYLPDVYQEDRHSASFTERFLANIEGFYTDIEGKLERVSQLFDPGSAPPETLDWLATWMGLVLDPLWARVGSVDRRRLLIRFARRLYERRGTMDGLRFSILLLLDPCLEETLKRLEQATVTPDPGLRRELESLGLLYPTRAMREADLEELLYQYVLSAPGRSRVRIVERWQTRQGQALQAGDVTEADNAQTTSLEEALRDAAHIFSVLLPENLSSEEAKMVERIVRMEKPVHTDYDLRRFWDYFLVGQARLGIDTMLGEEGRFLPIILGRDYLSEGYLESAQPMDTTERAISDRDRPGEMRL